MFSTQRASGYLATLAAAALLSGCGGGGGSAGGGTSSVPNVASQVQTVSGTIVIGAPQGNTSPSGSRSPHYVSTATAHAALFIDHEATAAGTTTSCTASNGTGTGCTISWVAELTVPASHVFTVETDTGPSILPHNTVLAVGQGTYTVFPGVNNLGTGGNGSPLSLNGVANTYFYNIGSCTGSSCTGTITVADAASYSIFYAGSLTSPTTGNSPTSGNVFDNSSVTFASDTPSIGVINGTAQAPYTTSGTNLLTILGVNSTQLWTYSVSCSANANGRFGLLSGGGASPSGDVTAAELSGLPTAVTYPGGPAGLDTTNLFTCTNGVASDASGTIVVN